MCSAGSADELRVQQDPGETAAGHWTGCYGKRTLYRLGMEDEMIKVTVGNELDLLRKECRAYETFRIL